MSAQDVGKMWKFVTGVVSEDGGQTLSLGRISFWVTFGITVFMWWAAREVPSSQETFLWVTLGYNFGKKGMDIMKFRSENGQPPKVSP